MVSPAACRLDPIWDGKYPTSVEEAKAWMGTESSGANAETE